MKYLALTLCASALAGSAFAADYQTTFGFNGQSALGSSLDTLGVLNGSICAAGYFKGSALDADLYIFGQVPGGGFWTKTIPTNGVGINRAVKLIGFGDGLYLAGTVYKSYNGISRTAMYLAKLSPGDGSVIWERSVAYASAKGLAIAGSGADYRVMVVGQEFNVNDSAQKRYVTLAVDLDGTNLSVYRPASYDGSSAAAVAGLTNSFAVGLLYSSGKAKVTQLDLYRARGWTTDISDGSSWTSLKLTSGDPSKTTDGTTLGVAGRTSSPNASCMTYRLSASGAILKEGISPLIGSLGPTQPWLFGDDLFAAYGRKNLPNENTELVTLKPNNVFGASAYDSSGSVEPAAMCLDANGGNQIVQLVEEPSGSSSQILVTSYSPLGSFEYRSSANGATPTDILTDGAGTVYVCGRKPVSGVTQAIIIGLVPVAHAYPETYETTKGEALSVDGPGVLANDFGGEGGTVTFPNLAHGTLTPGAGGGFTYTPDAGFVGVDFGQYTLHALWGAPKAQLTIYVFPKLDTLTFDKPAMTGGGQVVGTVHMSDNMPLGAPVSVSDNSTATDVPASVAVNGGASTATFPIATHPVASDKGCVITVSFRGKVYSKTLTVLAPAMQAIAVSPSSVKGGNGFNGSVTLTGKAPAGGVVVTLGHTGNEITLPGSVNAPAGQLGATFMGTTTVVAVTSPRTVSATANGVTKSVTLTITP